MTVNQAIEFFSQDPSSLTQRIAKRLQTLQDVGIGYIKLGQSSATLSGGESQRVKLAYFLAQEQQKATLFIFDEPTTGLHFHDIKVLLKAINALIDRGNSVIIIEHNTSVIMAADYVIDLGPEGGEKGGQLVFAGTPEQLILQNDSHTGQCLRQINTNH
jgi:excinuclease ABC subunit A